MEYSAVDVLNAAQMYSANWHGDDYGGENSNNTAEKEISRRTDTFSSCELLWKWSVYFISFIALFVYSAVTSLLPMGDDTNIAEKRKHFHGALNYGVFEYAEPAFTMCSVFLLVLTWHAKYIHITHATCISICFKLPILKWHTICNIRHFDRIIFEDLPCHAKVLTHFYQNIEDSPLLLSTILSRFKIETAIGLNNN